MPSTTDILTYPAFEGTMSFGECGCAPEEPPGDDRRYFVQGLFNFPGFRGFCYEYDFYEGNNKALLDFGVYPNQSAPNFPLSTEFYGIYWMPVYSFNNRVFTDKDGSILNIMGSFPLKLPDNLDVTRYLEREAILTIKYNFASGGYEVCTLQYRLILNRYTGVFEVDSMNRIGRVAQNGILGVFFGPKTLTLKSGSNTKVHFEAYYEDMVITFDGISAVNCSSINVTLISELKQPVAFSDYIESFRQLYDYVSNESMIAWVNANKEIRYDNLSYTGGGTINSSPIDGIASIKNTSIAEFIKTREYSVDLKLVFVKTAFVTQTSSNYSVREKWGIGLGVRHWNVHVDYPSETCSPISKTYTAPSGLDPFVAPIQLNQSAGYNIFTQMHCQGVGVPGGIVVSSTSIAKGTTVCLSIPFGDWGRMHLYDPD